MQSKKASKKTAKNAEEIVSPTNLENEAGVETSATPRSVRSSKPKSESGESTAAKRHRAATPVVSYQSAPAVEVAPKAMTAAAGQSAGSAVSVVIDPVGVETASSTPVAVRAGEGNRALRQVTVEEIASLAHSYWLARGGGHGGHEEDWFRAEQELKSRS
jgi:hypothetical protein